MKRHWSNETDFRALGDIVSDLKREVERAYYECREDDAAAAHDDLTSAEWRLRAAERSASK